MNGETPNVCQIVLRCLLLVTTEGLESVLQHAFPMKYCVLTASIFTPEEIKNT